MNNRKQTRIVSLMRRMRQPNNRKVIRLLLGQACKEINSWHMSLELKRSAYRHVLRVAGYVDMEEHVNTLAESFIR
jgi:hypothetical protein